MNKIKEIHINQIFNGTSVTLALAGGWEIKTEKHLDID